MHVRIGSAPRAGSIPLERVPEKRENAGAVSLDTACATAHIRAMIATSPPVSGAFTTRQAANADVLSALLALRRPLVMGILNVTPDSFSDGGAFLPPVPKRLRFRPKRSCDGSNLCYRRWCARDIRFQSTL